MQSDCKKQPFRSLELVDLSPERWTHRISWLSPRFNASPTKIDMEHQLWNLKDLSCWKVLENYCIFIIFFSNDFTSTGGPQSTVLNLSSQGFRRQKDAQISRCLWPPKNSTAAVHSHLHGQIQQRVSIPICGRRGVFHLPRAVHPRRWQQLPICISVWNAQFLFDRLISSLDSNAVTCSRIVSNFDSKNERVSQHLSYPFLENGCLPTKVLWASDGTNKPHVTDCEWVSVWFHYCHYWLVLPFSFFTKTKKKRFVRTPQKKNVIVIVPEFDGKTMKNIQKKHETTSYSKGKWLLSGSISPANNPVKWLVLTTANAAKAQYSEDSWPQSQLMVESLKVKRKLSNVIFNILFINMEISGGSQVMEVFWTAAKNGSILHPPYMFVSNPRSGCQNLQ